MSKTIALNKIFNIETARSDAFEKYSSGEVAFITNGDIESSFLGYVEPLEKDKVFYKRGICLTSFGEALIHNPPFLPRGNGGSGLLILLPKHEMSEEELYSYASQLNLQKWRFSFSRMVISRRIENISLKKYTPKSSISEEKQKLAPLKKQKKKINQYNNLKLESILDYCNIDKKTSIPQGQMENGNTPYVTTSSKNNGVSGFVDEEPNFEGKCLTVALNGSVGETFFQFENFITSGDNAVLTLKNNYNPYLLLYIASMIRNHKWRYNYYRKLNLTKLKKMQIPMPFKNSTELDLDYIESIVKNSYGFKEVAMYF